MIICKQSDSSSHVNLFMLLVEFPFFDPCLDHAFTIINLVHFLTVEAQNLLYMKTTFLEGFLNKPG